MHNVVGYVEISVLQWCLTPVAILRVGGPWPPRFLLGPPFATPIFFLNFPFEFVWLTYAGLPNALGKNSGHFVNSARSKLCPDSQEAQVKQRDNQWRYATINNLPVFWLLLRYISVCVCVCDVTIALRIATTAAHKLRWRNCPDKIYYKSHYNLRNSALVLFEVTANYLFSQYRFQTLIFKIPAVYRPLLK